MIGVIIRLLTGISHQKHKFPISLYWFLDRYSPLWLIEIISPLQFSVKVTPPDSVSTKLGPDPQTGIPIITKSKVPDLSKHGYHYKIKTEHVFLQSS